MVCKDAQVPPRAESGASARGTVCILGRPDAFRKRYVTLSSQRSGGKQMIRHDCPSERCTAFFSIAVANALDPDKCVEEGNLHHMNGMLHLLA